MSKEELLECDYFKKDNDYEISEEHQKELNILNRCLNLITNEISTDYLTIYAEKQIQLNFGELSLDKIEILNNNKDKKIGTIFE